MKVFLKLISVLGGGLLLPLVFAEQAWAWGPAIHAAISCTVLQKAVSIFPAVANVIQSFPLEYIYGSLAADFMVGKGQKKKPGHPRAPASRRPSGCSAYISQLSSIFM